MTDGAVLQVGTLNLASGRGPTGAVLTAERIAASVASLDVDVLAVQEVDAGQPRSGSTDQAAVVAAALGSTGWRFVATVAGTPGPVRSWSPEDPPVARGPGAELPGPRYGIALVSRRPVLEWSVLPLGGGRARLPVKAPDPRSGRLRWWWVPDEPRVAVAARLEGLTVVGTHLSFSPPTALRQLRALRRWISALPGPVVLAGDLNLPGALPARVLGGVPLVRAATFPGADPRLQLDHLVALGAEPAGPGRAIAVDVGDHRALVAPVRGGESSA
ncbi:endonuclease/exonuclease/phosphatase family protein [Blastococcus sp. URHD0036]|uniref:endonuclease/exonuclease/phosphatase family protein n=1 Tax=Blastococcus sp. URHD0036 TaxID=1380356 RepID=UPI000AA7ADBF|nr:endonuclease/exonuclease/phosphatase family protein [Blastococcus sp. URHD0036]